MSRPSQADRASWMPRESSARFKQTNESASLVGPATHRRLNRQTFVPSHEYEPLEGGTGKEVFYRQARFSILDILGKHVNIDHSVRFGQYSGQIIDFGINGVAFSTINAVCARDDILDELQVLIGDNTLYDGRASVRYCRTESNATQTIGVVLLDGILDTDAVISAANRSLTRATASSAGAR